MPVYRVFMEKRSYATVEVEASHEEAAERIAESMSDLSISREAAEGEWSSTGATKIKDDEE